MATICLSRRETFCASHRLHNPALSDAENKEIFGKCNNPNGHGHNFVLEVVVRGKIDSKTGMVINLLDLKKYIQVAVMDKLDHKHIDKDVPEFEGQISTTENLAVFIWNSLLKSGLEKSLLYEVRIHETENNLFIYRGE